MWKPWVMRHAGCLAWTVAAMGGIAVGCVLTGFWWLPPTLAAMVCVTALAWGVRGWVLRQRMDAIHQAPLPPFLRARVARRPPAFK